jgi:hypothetical protein
VFRRTWPRLELITSDEGFEVTFARNSVYYKDSRGKFAFSYEDKYLVPRPYQVEGEKVELSQPEIDQMADRLVRALEFRGDQPYIYGK